MPNKSYISAKIEAIKEREKKYREGEKKNLFDGADIHKKTLKKMAEANELRRSTHAYHNKPGEPEPVIYAEAREWVIDQLKMIAKARRSGDKERQRISRGGRARNYSDMGQGR